MPNVTSAIARAMQGRWGWIAIGVTISVLIVVAAAFTLADTLRDIDLGKVIAALQATQPEQLIAAGVFVVSGYITLTFYDFFSLRTIGRNQVPYRIAAFASFTSYSIGHNLGATVFTGGAVRLRIYSAWGLTFIDVAKIAFVTGLTFWIGNIFVLGLGLIFAPEVASAVDRLPATVNQGIGVLGLMLIGGYLAWLLAGPRAVGRGTWRIVLPSAPLTLVQIGIGLLDLGSGALAVYVLLPSSTSADFITVAVAYVAATLLGFLSHAPGSLGVFEAAMLVSLPQFQKEELLATLLIFRCIYFVIPLMLAASLLAIRELWLIARS
jgi:uncharacterized membrane protein YbhN (UPF0104 family)